MFVLLSVLHGNVTVDAYVYACVNSYGMFVCVYVYLCHDSKIYTRYLRYLKVEITCESINGFKDDLLKNGFE